MAVNEAYDGLGGTWSLYWNVYNRNSIDNNGMDLIGTVHYGTSYDNAFFNGSQIVFGDGDGVIFNRFTISIEIMGHELTHGVTAATAKLENQGQSGALNESISDVFGSLVKQYNAVPQQTAAQADWLIGAGLLTAGVNGVALRSMKAPGTAYNDSRLGGKDPQPDNMSGYVNTTSDNGGVHLNSGIPNRAFYLVAMALGGYAWEKAGHIWYITLLDSRLSTTASFVDFAKLTADNAVRLYGQAEQDAVIAAWATVGITLQFTPVYHQGDPGSGIGGYDLRSPADQVFAFDYDGSGKLDHLALYRPGTGTIWILKNTGGNFTPVYHQGDPGSGIGGYDLRSPADQVFAFDYDGSGKLDHLALLPARHRHHLDPEEAHGRERSRPSTIKATPATGLAATTCGPQADRVFAFDYDGTASSIIWSAIGPAQAPFGS